MLALKVSFTGIIMFDCLINDLYDKALNRASGTTVAIIAREFQGTKFLMINLYEVFTKSFENTKLQPADDNLFRQC